MTKSKHRPWEILIEDPAERVFVSQDLPTQEAGEKSTKIAKDLMNVTGLYFFDLISWYANPHSYQAKNLPSRLTRVKWFFVENST
jgi:hypothetical protein